MTKKSILGLAFLGIIILVPILGYYFYTHYYLPSTLILPQPLANVEFPAGQAQYPADWPEELRFPPDFVLADASSGTLPEGTTTGWAVKLRIKGNPSEAKQLISEFLKDKGWTAVESDQLDSGGFSLIIKRENGNGIVVIDPDPNISSQTLVIVTVFP